GAVVVDVDDLLPLELVEPALLVADVPDHGRGLAPVVGGEVEHPREPPAVGRGAHAVAHRQNRHLVHRRLRDELIGDARAVGVHDQRTGPGGSTIRKKMMRPPNTISSICFCSATGRCRPTVCGAFVRRIGTRTMKAAPRNDPRMEPSPPMITMNRTRKESVTSKASVSALPK